MKKWGLLVLFLLVLFISACAPKQQEQPQQETQQTTQITKPYLSDEVDIGSNANTQVTCPKELIYPANINPNTEIEVKFTAKYDGYGSTNFATGLECDDGYTATTNPIRVDLEQNQSQIVEAKITTSSKLCTFKLVELANIDNIISCNIMVKAA